MAALTKWIAPGRSAPTRCLHFLFLVCLGNCALPGAPTPLVIESRVLTNIYEIWEMSPEARAKLYPFRSEFVLYYFDPEWNIAWGECQGRPAYLPIADCPTRLKAGQRVSIDGVVSPLRERILWDKTRIHILQQNIEVAPEPIQNLLDKPRELDKRLISVDALIDRQMEDSTHVTVSLLATGGATTTLYIQKDGSSGIPFQFKPGDLVRVKGVYAPQYNRDGKVAQVSLWAAHLSAVQIIGSLNTDSRFEAPIVLAESIQDSAPTNDLLHVQGVVRRHEPGKWVTLWDDTGQIMVQSRQTSSLRFGDRIEAIGYPYVLGVQRCLHDGLYRLSVTTNLSSHSTPASEPPNPVRLAEQVRDLSRAEASRHLPVNLRALVTWSHKDTPFAYVEDASGGVRLVNPTWDSLNSSLPGTIVLVTGITAEGEFVPVITNAVIRRAGFWNLDEEVPPVSLEEALTGIQDGRWIEMRGFVRNVSLRNGLAYLDLSTSGGEFQACTPASQDFDYLKGSIIRVRGVCAAVPNSRHQLTGIQIWAPEVKYIQIEEAAPEDLFAISLRSLNSLRQFNLHNALDQRVRTIGTVVLHAPGRYLYIQEGADSVLALCPQTEVLHPGDRVEVVGFPGNQGERFLLREAVFRRVAKGAEPAPIQLADVHSIDLDLEGRLARAEGILLNSVDKNGEARLLIQSKDYAFEVSLDSPPNQARPAFKLGSRLAVTGVYEVQSDGYAQARSFRLHLRSWSDVLVLSQPSWWTLARLFRVLLTLAGIAIVAVIWGIVIVSKNRLLHHAQAQLQTANDQLELRVQERTRELQEQVVAKERARTELAETQEHLILASRQAGMAEVATSVLHNVGNVLNSVNVSAALISQRLRASRLEFVAKSAALLQQTPDKLARFLTEDPKGKVLPDYLQKLAASLLDDQRKVRDELDYLTKNIDHIKVIVTMQQSHAKAGGVVEEVAPQDLLEDSLQITSGSFERNGIRLLRSYSPVPHVMVDRHKVLQILVNLITNAKHALTQAADEKTLSLSVSAPAPDRVRITVADNGIGIPPENLRRIFSQGFTTRKDGHGFGLHSGANAARELGGSLSVHSDGPGRGAAFTLELPARTAADTKS